MRLHLQANGLYLTVYHSCRQLGTRINSAILAAGFRVHKLTIEPPFVLSGRRYIVMGENFSAGPGLWLDAISRYGERSFQPTILIGANVSLSHSVHIAATTYVEIGSDVLMGSRVLITDHNHGTYNGLHPSDPAQPPSKRPLEEGRRTVIGDRVWLGDGVVVTPGSSVGDGTIIGANSVVIGAIPCNSIAAGAPAKVIKRFDIKSQQWLKDAG